MTPNQREAALRLADRLHSDHPDYDPDFNEAAALLLELAAEPVQEPYCTVYEYDSALGLHQELYPRPWNGMKPTRAIPLYAAPQQRTEYSLAETDIYDFAGWLTTRKGTLVVGTSHEAGPMAEAVGEYLRTFPERFAPQQRQPLTDDELSSLFEASAGYGRDDFISFARAVEKAILENNNG